jgi:multiple antibiotic resistance protein
MIFTHMNIDFIEFGRIYLQCLITILIAINLPGVLPIFSELTDGMSKEQRNRLTLMAIMAGFGMATAFLFAGHFIFAMLRITVDDLRIGGGLVLLVLSITNLVFGDLRQRAPASEDLGIVPIGIPLMIGPSALTTIIVSQQSYGYIITSLALLTNACIVYVMFSHSHAIMGRIGKGAGKAASKVSRLFLSATAVAMIRKGITGAIKTALGSPL